ncbi:MAG: hypothetical protein K0R92_414 [Lachnospiraceae bacterium]|jgi:hypothetical protein|nr:hypothetical protein [Lachnospiraceae bacterium]
MNVYGTIVREEMTTAIENEFKDMETFPSKKDEEYENNSEKSREFLRIRNNCVFILFDFLNLATWSNLHYEVSESDTEEILDLFQKYASNLIQLNKDTLIRVYGKLKFTMNRVEIAGVFNYYDEHDLEELIAYAKNNIEEYNRQRNMKTITSRFVYLLDRAKERDFYGNALEKKYLNYNPTFLESVMTFAEATEKWGLGESTLRSMVRDNRLKEDIDYRKSGKVWLIRKDSMIKLYGAPKLLE